MFVFGKRNKLWKKQSSSNCAEHKVITLVFYNDTKRLPCHLSRLPHIVFFILGLILDRVYDIMSLSYILM